MHIYVFFVLSLLSSNIHMVVVHYLTLFSTRPSKDHHLRNRRLVDLFESYLSTAGMPISQTHTKNQFANEPEGLRHF